MKHFYLIICALSFAALAIGQSSIGQLPVAKENVHVTRSPFRTLIVLNSCFDSSTFHIYQNGQYPVLREVFQEPLAILVKDYCEKVLEPISTSTDTILINIRQMRTGNLPGVYLRGSDGKDRFKMMNSHVLFAADVYHLQNEANKLLFSIDKSYRFHRSNGNFGAVIANIFNDVLDLATVRMDSTVSMNKVGDAHVKRLMKDPDIFCPSTTTLHIWDYINRSAQLRWNDYPIIQQEPAGTGIFPTFDDFRSNRIQSTEIILQYDEKDSIYLLKKMKYRPWAVLQDGVVYINIESNKYVKAEKIGNSFHFRIPWSLPDMFSLCSIHDNVSGSYSNIPVSDNILVSAIGFVVWMGVEFIAASGREKKIRREGLKHDERNCVIDMDSGDIIYSGAGSMMYDVGCMM